MLLVYNNDATKKFQSSDLKKLAECDEILPYHEAGWYCVAGYKGKQRLVHVHFSSQDEYEYAMGIKKPTYEAIARGYAYL